MYYVGIYARLSVDGDDRKNESVDTQLEIAKAFISRQEDMTIFDCYTDMGKTGTSFEREGFERMMRDVRMRRINCIVVKDLSRFGRNYIETGNYIEKIFPFLGVRFIAVADDFDSMGLSGQNEAFGMNLKNLINEMYAKDIAVKVRSSRRAKWEQGSYTGGIAPYGYQVEQTKGIRRLFVEAETAAVVKQIFSLFLDGKSMGAIVIWLYEHHIVSPAVYHQTGQVYCKETQGLLQWSKTSVKAVLTNPVYMGCLIQGRGCPKGHMLRTRDDIDAGDCAVKEHTHEAIVSEEVFFEAAARFEKASARMEDGFAQMPPTGEDIFSDILYCGVCGAKLKRISAIKNANVKEKVRIYSYHCPKADRIDCLKCSTKNITLCQLENIVKKAVRQEISLSDVRQKEIEAVGVKAARQRKDKWNRQLCDVEKKIAAIAEFGSRQYLNYRMGRINERDFRQLKEENDKKTVLYQRECVELVEKLKAAEDGMERKRQSLRALIKGDDKAKLTAEAVQALIDRIALYPDDRISVQFAFMNSSLAEKIYREGALCEKISDCDVHQTV